MLDKVPQPGDATDFAEQLRAYVEVTLHQPVRFTHWLGATGLPVFLSHRYDFLTGSISRHPCLFAVDRGTINVTPTEVSKHLVHIERVFDGIVIYAAQRLSADRRARLIANNVSFVIPGNQLYIPQLALDLREYFRARPKRKQAQFSPVTQALLFYHLLSLPQPPEAFLGSYSTMSAWRAYEELRQLELVKISKRGRANWIDLIAEPRQLFDMAGPFLRDPARSRKYVGTGSMSAGIMQAGESALAALTDLSPPALPVYAVHYKEWGRVIADSNLTLVKHDEDAKSIMELWHYDPKILATAGIVDRLSLYAQFRNHSDERIAKAAEDLLEQISW